MVSNRPVDRGDELWFYYTGMKRRVEQHDRYTDGSPRSPETLSPMERADWLDDTHSAVCLAVLRRDGFVSLDAGANGGYLLTKPLEAVRRQALSQPGRRQARKRAGGGRRPIGPRCRRVHERGCRPGHR